MTQTNLFRPPEAMTADIPVETTRRARPISAWLLEVFLVFMIVAWAAGAWRTTWAIALDWQQVGSPIGAAVAVAYRVAGIALFCVTLWGTHRGRSWARWLGLALLVAVTISSVVHRDDSIYPNEAQRAGAHLAALVVPIVCAWWAWAFAFSAKAKRYFAPAAEAAA